MARNLSVAAAVVVLLAGAIHTESVAAQRGGGGIIVGHVRLTGPATANPLIRFGADPLCSKINRGQRRFQEYVLRAADGGLANAFVDVEGKFAQTPPPVAPVTIDQHECLYSPRVVGLQVGQTLQVTNSDPMMHNIHSLSTTGNEFNTSQPKPGMVFKFQARAPESMMRMKCDVHSWMVAWVGVRAHPHFAVTSPDGAFRIQGVPPGKYMLRSWHERYGIVTMPVTVTTGQTSTVDFSYTGKEKPPAA
jgi:plastocyanin